MSTINWGMLTKSQTDPETIEEAINRIVADHNNDASAHLDVGQSLQSHKASAIIDHLALSIVNDKLEKGAVTTEKIYEDKFYYKSTFESLDSWLQTKGGTGADVFLGGGSCVLRPGHTAGDITRINATVIYTAVDSGKNPYFQYISFFPGDETYIDASVMCGCVNPFNLTASCFGFFWDGSENKMYCRVVDGSTPTDYEIPDFVPESKNVLRAEFDDVNDEVRFYLNGSLIHTADATGIVVDSDTLIVAGVQNSDGTDDVDYMIQNLIFSQDN